MCLIKWRFQPPFSWQSGFFCSIALREPDFLPPLEVTPSFLSSSFCFRSCLCYLRGCFPNSCILGLPWALLLRLCPARSSAASLQALRSATFTTSPCRKLSLVVFLLLLLEASYESPWLFTGWMTVPVLHKHLSSAMLAVSYPGFRSFKIEALSLSLSLSPLHS